MTSVMLEKKAAGCISVKPAVTSVHLDPTHVCF